MRRCPACGSEIPEESRFCLTCGAVVAPSSLTPTRTAHAIEDRARRVATASDPVERGRFIPGTILAGRYRIVGPLGRGGMGEVYRADDLKLGQSVALKLLPQALGRDAAALARLHNEVRVARQVSHPNVCRVYDIGEAEGLHFLSMEYVDGEDLASLLRRIGRFPGDRAVEIARQICAGLAAAHDLGVLHRDLKPANVMIDGRGRARITDFGLAGIAGEVHGAEVLAGTPAYMAPEQFAGKEVTVRSDIYSLGLVLYEIFTGRRALEPGSHARSAGTADTPTVTKSAVPTPSSHVRNLDPAVERVILRCLEENPAARPPSAIAVAAALPGGDPLAAALAAGETPSPEMVAAAGEAGVLRPAVAWGCLAAVGMSLLILILGSGRSTMVNIARPEKPPDALEDRAKLVLERFGLAEPAAGTARGFEVDTDYLRFVERTDFTVRRWDHLSTGRPAVIRFWHRRSPRPLAPLATTSEGRVSREDPPENLPGMVTIVLDQRGRLVRLLAVPTEGADPMSQATMRNTPTRPAAPAPPATTLDPALLFSEAGLDLATFEPVDPIDPPPVFADSWQAWKGPLPETPHAEVRVEIASLRDRPVYMRLAGPWTRPAILKDGSMGPLASTGAAIAGAIFLISLVAGVFLARRNLREGSCDRRGALKLACYVFGLIMLAWIVGGTHVGSLDAEWTLFLSRIENALAIACIMGLMYLALEPYVRRRWPDVIISWSRLLAGRLRDPLVGRDLLIGSLMGTLYGLVDELYHLLPGWLGLPPQAPHPVDPVALLGGRHALSAALDTHLTGLTVSLGVCFFLVLLRMVLRNQRAAAVSTFIIGVFGNLTGAGNPYIQAIYAVLVSALVVSTLLRYGMLAVVVGWTLWSILMQCPVTTDLSSWYSGTGLFAVTAVVAVAAYGFYSSLAGRPAFGAGLLEE